MSAPVANRTSQDPATKERTTLSGELELGRRDRLLREVESLSLEKLRGRARELLGDGGSLAADLTERRTDPYRTAAILEERITGGP